MLKRLAVAVLAVLVLAACKGHRLKVMEDASDQGSWRMDGTLIRKYHVTLTEAYDAIVQLAKNEDWRVTKRSSSPYGAQVHAVTQEGDTPVRFEVWAPAGKAVEVGVEYDGGDRIQSIRVFEKLEKILLKKDTSQEKEK